MSSFFRTRENSDPRWESDGLSFITVKSPALRRRADLTVFVPAAGRTTRNLPLVILLHGVYGSHWAWAYKGGAHRTLERLMGQNLVPPMALAMPSDGLLGDGSGYLNRAEGDFERWIVEEVPRAVMESSTAIDAASPLFLCGLSMGGFGALRLGAKFGRRFRGISGHSSITHLEQMRAFVEEPVDVAALPEEEVSVLAAMLKNRDRLPPLRFDCGSDDPLIEANRTLHREMERHGLPHRFEELPGGHEWPYWERNLEKTLLFFGLLG
jgi:putative tributyrin esterase